MQIEKFKRDFKRLNGVFFEGDWVLFRVPLQLYNLKTEETIDFESLEEALNYNLNGETLEKQVSSWEAIIFPVEHGGRGGGSGLGFSGKWPSAINGGGGKDETIADHPARMNVKVGVNRTYEDMLKAFIDTHGNAAEEHGVVVDAYGFATKYRHGNAGSISGLTGNGTEIALHNHPKDGWPTFSKEDVVNTALGTRRGIVAVSTTAGRDETTAKYAGTYSFVKGTHFNSSGFVKAINNANISGKDYNDAVHKWLTRNQKKYGYKYSYSK